MPQAQEDAVGHPLLEAIMGGGFGTQGGLVERFPMAAGTQHEENAVGAAVVGDAGTPAAAAVGIDVNR